MLITVTVLISFKMSPLCVTKQGWKEQSSWPPVSPFPDYAGKKMNKHFLGTLYCVIKIITLETKQTRKCQ